MRASRLLAAASAAVAARAAVPTVHMPLNIRYGENNKVSTTLLLPYSNTPIDVCYDLGSSDFFLFGPNSTMNWGRDCLSCQGACNMSVPMADTYDPALSTTASTVEPWNAFYAYGGGLSKGYVSQEIVNDTFTFVNDANYSTTVPDVQVALAWYLQQRIKDPNGTCNPVPLYDFSIMGIAPYYSSPDPRVENTTGPSFRQNLLDQGLIAAPVQSMWFEVAPDALNETYTGSGLQGGIDMSKVDGPLVKVNSILATDLGYSYVGYYTNQSNVTFTASDGSSTTDIPIDRTGYASDDYCLIDSGAFGDSLAPVNQTAFLETTGLVYNPARPYPGEYLSWPHPCSSIPTDPDVSFLTYTFVGLKANETLEINMPLRAYARHQAPEDQALGWCTINISLGECLLGTPFMTRAFFAADDERGELALGKGGLAARGSGIDGGRVVGRIP
jgi:hypothetical protein